MQDQPTYYNDGVARVLDVLKDTFGTTGIIRKYINGDPGEIPESYLPCIMVTETVGRIDIEYTGMDTVTETILITVAMNKNDDLGAPDDTQMTEFKLRKLIKGQDPTTGQYLRDTIMYALRTHITMQNSVVRSDVNTDFKQQLRGAELVTQEAYVELTIERHIGVPTRD